MRVQLLTYHSSAMFHQAFRMRNLVQQPFLKPPAGYFRFISLLLCWWTVLLTVFFLINNPCHLCLKFSIMATPLDVVRLAAAIHKMDKSLLSLTS